MTDHSASPRPRRLDPAAIDRHIRRLTAAYPEFLFSHELLGWKGARWVAERRDRRAPGLHTVITDDLMELHAALARDKASRHAR
jgi:hypothetical protein